MNADCDCCKLHFTFSPTARMPNHEHAVCPYCGCALVSAKWMGGISSITTVDVTTGHTKKVTRRVTQDEPLYPSTKIRPLPRSSFVVSIIREIMRSKGGDKSVFERGQS